MDFVEMPSLLSLMAQEFVITTNSAKWQYLKLASHSRASVKRTMWHPNDADCPADIMPHDDISTGIMLSALTLESVLMNVHSSKFDGH